MPKLIFAGDTLMAAAIDNPDECQRIIEALEFVLEAEHDQRSAFVRKHDLPDLPVWIAQIAEILRQFKTELPR